MERDKGFLLPQGSDRLFAVQSQLNFLFDCLSQPDGPLELSDGGHEGLCEFVGSLHDEVKRANDQLMAEAKKKRNAGAK